MFPLWWMRGRLMEEAADPAGGGGGGGAPAAFDPVKFKTELMGDVTKMFNGGFARIEKLVKPATPSDPAGGGGGGGDPDPDPKPGAQKDPAVARLEKELTKLRGDLDTERKGRAEATETARKEKRVTTLTNELGKLGVQPDRIKSALRAVDPDIKFAEDGSLVGDDDTPLSDYLATWIKGNEHFLPPKSVGGAGATSGNGRGAASVDIDDIKPGMKPEDIARVRAEILRVAGGK